MSQQSKGIQFERPLGSPADVKELEYVAALHQTNPEGIRTEGTINAKDIRNYLTSRHGIYAEASVIEDRIIHELCGTFKDKNDEELTQKEKKRMALKNKHKNAEPMMDICQMAVLLLIPYLRHEDINETKKPVNSIEKGMAEHVMNLLLEEVERQEGVSLDDFKAVDENFETGTKISPKLLQHMFDSYGEYNVPEQILGEMVDHAVQATKLTGKKKKGGSDNSEGSDFDPPLEDSMPMINLRTKKKKTEDAVQIFLNKATFQRALTADIQIYDPKVELRDTPHLADAINSKAPKGSLAELAKDTKVDRVKHENDFYTAPSIDQAADQYRSYSWLMLLWISFLLYYGLYMWDYVGTVDFESCDFEFGCDAATSIVNWVVVFVELSTAGTLFIYFGSLGNWATGKPLEGADQAKTIGGIFVAMAAVACATIIPNFIEGEVFVWDSVKVEGWDAMYWFCLALGIVLICLQLVRMISVCAPLGAVGDGGKVRSEQCIKEAATKKVNVMVDNAMLLHVAPIVAGTKPKVGAGIRYPAKYASPIVVKIAAELHEEHDEDNEKNKYRDGNIETLTGGEGSNRALVNYKWMFGVTETVGGVIWAYQRIADGRIFDEEGIWISARLITSNVLQAMVVVFQLILYFSFLALFEEEKSNTVAIGQRRLIDESLLSNQPKYSPSLLYDGSVRRRDAIQGHQHPRLPHFHYARVNRTRRLQITVSPYNETHYATSEGVFPHLIYDFNSTHFTDGRETWHHNTFSHNGTHVFDKFYPKNETHFTDGHTDYPFSQYATNGTHITDGQFIFDGRTISKLPGNPSFGYVETWEFQIGLAFGLVAALLGTIGIVVVYIPSFVSTVLKFRCGVFRTLKNSEFQRLRDGPQHVTAVLGSALWGSFFTGFFLWLFVGGLVFVSVWSETRETFLQIYSFLIGLLSIYLVRFVMERLFRDLYVSSFYRKHPAVMNFLNVLFECWNLSIAIGLMLARAFKLVIVSAIYIGRIDVPTFSPGVGYVGPYGLDSEHYIFKKDLLVHEAHRHPYLERLGMMYLLKLQHGNAFGTRAGAYWRLLFVLALMPWLQDYRFMPYGKLKDQKEDKDSDEDDEFESEKTDNDSVMSPHGMELELDLTRRVNESLNKRNKDLKDALSELRQRLREANKKVAKLERKVGKSSETNENFKSVRGPTAAATAAASAQQVDDQSESEFESSDESEGSQEQSQPQATNESESDLESSFESDEGPSTKGAAVQQQQGDDDSDSSFESDDESGAGSSLE